MQETDLPRNEPLHLQNKKINKGLIEQITLKKCKGVIDEATFKDFPKVSTYVPKLPNNNPSYIGIS